MKKKKFCFAICLLVAFAFWTALICLVDVRSIGPKDSSVGFATLNKFVNELTGVNWALYTITDWLGIVPIVVSFGFAMLGIAQLIERKSILKVDYSILILGVFYLVVIAVYVFFETVIINYRPTLIDGYLESSYPSSTTMLVTCVMPTAVMQLNTRIKNVVLRRVVIIIIMAFTIFMVIGRLLSGVHWVTDIIGGLLISAGLVTAYDAFRKCK